MLFCVLWSVQIRWSLAFSAWSNNWYTEANWYSICHHLTLIQHYKIRDVYKLVQSYVRSLPTMYYPRVILFLLLFNTAASIEINGINLSHPKVLLKNKTLKVIMGHVSFYSLVNRTDDGTLWRVAQFPPSTIINRSDNGTTINYDGLLFHYLDWLSQYTGFK